MILPRRILYLAATGLALVGLLVTVLVMKRPERGSKAAAIEASPTAFRAAAPPAAPRARPQFVGVVLARESVDVASKLEGRLKSVLVKLGDAVRRDALIATLDGTPMRQELAISQASLRARQAELQKADVQLTEARRRLARVAALDRVVSEQDRAAIELEEKLAATALEVARAHVDEEMARVSQLQERLSQAEIRAPFDGTVAARYQDPGTLLQSGAPVVRLIRSEELWVRFAVPESDLTEIAVGRPVNVDIQSLGTTVPGVIEHIAPEVDAAAQMVVVEARLEVPSLWKAQIQSGLVGHVSAVGGAASKAAQGEAATP